MKKFLLVGIIALISSLPFIIFSEKVEATLCTAESLEPGEICPEPKGIYVPPSLREQIKLGFSIDEILCPNNSHLLAERPNGKLACVYPTTAEKLEWQLIKK